MMAEKGKKKEDEKAVVDLIKSFVPKRKPFPDFLMPEIPDPKQLSIPSEFIFGVDDKKVIDALADLTNPIKESVERSMLDKGGKIVLDSILKQLNTIPGDPRNMVHLDIFEFLDETEPSPDQTDLDFGKIRKRLEKTRLKFLGKGI